MNASKWGNECPAPLTKPIDSNGRGLYETGKPHGNFNNPALPTVAWESISHISNAPCWLLSLFVVTPVTVLDAAFWVLIFDLNPGNAAQLALVQNGAIARYTFGPIRATDMLLQGGVMVYEAQAEEVPCRPMPCAPGQKQPEVKGIPFNFGIIAAASITPRILTNETGQGVPLNINMAVTARMQL